MGERSWEKAGNGGKPLPAGDAGTASFLNWFRKGDVLVGIVENDGDIVLRNQVDGADFPVRLACVPESAGHQLRAVAESEYRNAHLKQFPAACSSTFLINAVRTSG